MITASHNPPYDNGYKVYFSDGAQVIEPHASGIIAKVNAITTEIFTPLPKDRQGRVTTIGKEIDVAYLERLETLILDPRIIPRAKSLRIVHSPLHGTGRVIIKPMLKRLGFNFEVVPEQEQFDGRFPTVKSPNPENPEALTMAIDLAEKEDADLVVATDPDCDRMGAAVRASNGRMKLLTGNQIGSLLAWYRTRTLFEKGVLNKQNASRGVIIKTFITTDLQKVHGKTIDELIDHSYSECGFFAEKNGSLVFEGAEGATKIARLIKSYAADPFPEVLGSKVTSVRNFETDKIEDAESDQIPKEKM